MGRKRLRLNWRGIYLDPLKLISRLGALLLVLGLTAARADTPPLHLPERINSKLFIAPSSSKLAGGVAKLVVGPLRRDALEYVGDYRIKVIPYFFKNESGRLFIKVSERSLHRMVQGHVTGFSGHAETSGSGLTRKITARAIPTANGCGALTFTVATENGPLVFNTSYRIDKP